MYCETDIVTVYDVNERMDWGTQTIATVWNRATAEDYCASRPGHFVEARQCTAYAAFNDCED